LYFTSKVYVKIFVGANDEEDEGDENSRFHTITDGWDLT
jgi:hypothetical protein